MRCKAYWDKVKITYGEIDYLCDTLHRAIYVYVGKDGLTPVQEDALERLCRSYKHWADIQDKGQPNTKFAQEPVKALVEKYRETP